MNKEFPEFSETHKAPSSPRYDMVPRSEVQALVKAELKKNAMHSDSWQNLVVGLGGVADKSKYTQIADLNFIDDASLTVMYANDGLTARVVNVLADDMTREWIDLEDAGEADEEVIEEALETLSAEKHFNEALRWQRLYGGALLIIGALDGRTPDQPLNEKAIKSIEYLKVVDRTDIPITECEMYMDPSKPKFGQVKVYKINMYINGQYIPMRVHESRCIAFHNDPMPNMMRQYIDSNYRFWGMSSIQPIHENLRDLGGINQSVVNVLYEFVVGKYKIAHLAEMMSMPGGEAAVVKRIEIMNYAKSVLNSVMLDADGEDYSRDYASLAGLPEIIDRFMLGLSGSTGIPVTRLFGRSPSGLNATGENDLRNYYDLVEANQRNRLKSPLQYLVRLICSWKGIKTVPAIVFNSLYQMTETEAADVDYKKAQTKQAEANTAMTYVNMGALDPDEVRHETLGKKGTVEVEEEDPEEEAAGFDFGSDPRKQPMKKVPPKTATKPKVGKPK